MPPPPMFEPLPFGLSYEPVVIFNPASLAPTPTFRPAAAHLEDNNFLFNTDFLIHPPLPQAGAAAGGGFWTQVPAQSA